jgi:hypothetical protein
MESDDDASEMEPLLDEESGSWADRGDEEDRGTTSGGEDDELLTSEESSRSEGGSVSEGAEADPEHGSTGTPTHDLFASDFSILTEAAIVTVQGTPLALCSLLMVFSSWVDLAVVARLGITELSAAGLVHAIQVIGMTGAILPLLAGGPVPLPSCKRFAVHCCSVSHAFFVEQGSAPRCGHWRQLADGRLNGETMRRRRGGSGSRCCRARCSAHRLQLGRSCCASTCWRCWSHRVHRQPRRQQNACYLYRVARVSKSWTLCVFAG